MFSLTHVSTRTFALITLNEIDTSCIVFALVLLTVVYVCLASQAGETTCTLATAINVLVLQVVQIWWDYSPKSAFFQNFASGAVSARIAIASVYHKLTILSVIAWCTLTFVFLFCLGGTCSSILTRKRVACITLSQNFGAYFAWKVNRSVFT